MKKENMKSFNINLIEIKKIKKIRKKLKKGKCECLIGEEILPLQQHRIIEKAKFTYLSEDLLPKRSTQG